jgi:hypothetical protein
MSRMRRLYGQQRRNERDGGYQDDQQRELPPARHHRLERRPIFRAIRLAVAISAPNTEL